MSARPRLKVVDKDPSSAGLAAGALASEGPGGGLGKGESQARGPEPGSSRLPRARGAAENLSFQPSFSMIHTPGSRVFLSYPNPSEAQG